MIENPITWPDGYRCALAISWDVDCESSMHWYNRETADNLIATHTATRYDLVAIRRIMKVLKERGLRQTFFFPGWCIEKYPDLVDDLLADGHEVALHGYLHERCNELPPEEEAHCLDLALEAFRARVGDAAPGWRAPSFAFSRHSLDLLLARGFAYDSSLMGDDVPYVIENDAGSMVELPVEWVLDDWPHYVHNRDFRFMMPISAPQRAAEVFRSEFEANRLIGGLCTTVWHPFVSGRPARLLAALELIDEMRAKGDVWLTTTAEIAAHVAGQIKAGLWQPRRERIPLYTSPLPEFAR